MFFKLKNFMDHSYSRNVAFAFIMGFFCVTLGSLSTALFVASCAVLVFFNTKIYPREVWKKSISFCKKAPIIFVFPAFFILVVITSMQGGNGLGSSVFVAGSYWQFLFIIPATVGLYHLSKDINFAGLFSLGCRFGLIFVVPLSLIQIYFFNLRPEGILSNALVFASLCIAGAGISMIEWKEDTHNSRIWSVFLFAAGILAALLTFSRGMLIPIAIVIAIVIFYSFKVKSNFKINFKIFSIIIASVIAMLIASLSTDNGWRILNKRVLEPIAMFQKGEAFDTSISQRLDMQITGFNAFTKSPFTGYGIQNAVKQSNEVSIEVLGRKTEYTYTHLHNDYLTHAVGGGVLLLFLFILVILSPVLMTWSLRRDKNEIALFYFSLVLSGAYSAIAMTNIVFHNDQLTTMFCAGCMFVMVRRYQLLEGVETVRIPDLEIIANGINPLGLKPSDNIIKT